MKTIGGFLGLERPAGHAIFHPQAAALASGRACWHAIVLRVKPRRVLVPFYVCDAVLQPLTAVGIDYEFYAINDGWMPDLASGPRDGELLLVVNYFGLFSPAMRELTQTFPGRTVVDDTQAFFRTGDAASWSFNSARKFFGVPDGGYLYGPAPPAPPYPPSATGDCAHLRSRLAGDDETALREYREHESRISIDVRAMSPLSDQLLAAVDADAVRRRRRANFAALHARLGACNQTRVALGDQDDDVPMCYPFLSDTRVDLEALWRDGLFIPQFWPELAGRATPGFDRERDLADRLLPLPIDHRYGTDDMTMLCDRLLHLLAR